MEKGTRIQKVLSEQGIVSRRKAEEWIEQGKIKVNGRPALLGQKINPNRDVVTIDGERVYFQKSSQKYYIMLHKPRGYVTTMSDELGRKCVAELVEDVPERVYPIGRLDKDSEGMLLFTNDGEFANLIMHPSHHVSKTYRVTVRPDVSDAQVVQLSTGVVIDGKKTSPAHVTVLEKEPGRVVMQVVIYEGRNRQVRKMCEAVGLEVARLKRTAIGPLKLGMLAPGKWRELRPGEIGMLRNAIKASSGAPELLNDLDDEILGSTNLLPAGHQLATPELLFEKIEDSVIEAQVQKLLDTKKANEEANYKANPIRPNIEFDDFMKLDIRVGTVLECQKVPKADKLLQFKIADGLENRTIVSGIAQHYNPEELVGKQVCFIANLAPRKLKGIVSEGMILSAENFDGSLSVVTTMKEVKPGSEVK